MRESILSYHVGSGREELIPTEPSRPVIASFCYYLFVVYMCAHAKPSVQVRSQLAGVRSLLPLGGRWGLNPGGPIWQQAHSWPPMLRLPRMLLF